MSERPTAGWYPDPQGSGELRYWDGTAWTKRVETAADVGNIGVKRSGSPRSSSWPRALLIGALVVAVLVVGGMAAVLMFSPSDEDTDLPDAADDEESVDLADRQVWRQWWAVTARDAMTDDHQVLFAAVVHDGRRFVAVGVDPVERWNVWAGNAVAATSVDGVRWEHVVDDGSVFGPDNGIVLKDVVAGGPGFVAVGWQDRADIAPSEDETVEVVATSVDGRQWQRVAHNEGVFGGSGRQQMMSVTVGGPGLVAVGFDQSHEVERSVAAVWVSEDGVSWERVEHGEAFEGVQYPGMSSITVAGSGLVAVGSDFIESGSDSWTQRAVVWRSGDGVVWERVPHNAEVFGGDDLSAYLLDVVAGGPGLVAVGSESWMERGPTRSRAMAWVSQDGELWRRASIDSVQVVDEVDNAPLAPLPPTSEEPQATPEPPAHEDPVPRDPRSGRMMSVVATGSGLVAVGASERSPGIWISSTGNTWEQLPIKLDIGSHPLFTIAIGPSGLIAVGPPVDEVGPLIMFGE